MKAVRCGALSQITQPVGCYYSSITEGGGVIKNGFDEDGFPIGRRFAVRFRKKKGFFPPLLPFGFKDTHDHGKENAKCTSRLFHLAFASLLNQNFVHRSEYILLLLLPTSSENLELRNE